MKFFDDKTKKLNWFTRNYLFVGTLFLIAVTFVCFYTVNDKMRISANDYNFMQLIYGTFGHLDFGHIAGNMITLAFVGLFFERKYGTLAMLIGYLVMSVLCNFAMIKVQNLYAWVCGASCAINGFYGFFFVSLLFDFRNIIKDKTNLIIHVLCFICFFIAMFIALPDMTGWCEIFRVVHWPGFLVGSLIGIFFFGSKILIQKNTNEKAN